MPDGLTESSQEATAAERVLRLASEVVSRYSEAQAHAAIRLAERKKHGLGCLCSNCVKAAVGEANSWISWLAEDEEEAEDQHYHIASGKGGRGLSVYQDLDDMKMLRRAGRNGGDSDEMPFLSSAGPAR